MRKREGGQAFILVLILLAIGAMLVIPALQLTGTTLKSSQIVTRQARALYAADAAQEYVVWKLRWDNWGQDFTTENPEGYAILDCCGVSVNISVIMRAVPGKGGVILSTDDVIQPTKTVSPNTIPNDTTETVTYTIRLEQLSSNTTQGLDAIYDILPDMYDDSEYVTGSCQMRIDGGPWLPLNQAYQEPAFENPPSRWRLKWPADYDPDTGTGGFSSDNSSPNYFYGMRDFNVRQVKELKFQMTHEFKGADNNRVHCNWVVLKVGDTNTVSGPQAPLTVGNPANPGVCDNDGLIAVDKVSDPEIIQPGVETDIEYTVNITNRDGFTNQIEEITDYLPPGFNYCPEDPEDPDCPSPSGITTAHPQRSLVNVNGVDRWKLHWVFSPAMSIQAAETLTLTFWATATKDVSGSYYNEVIVISNVPIPTIFSDIGIIEEDYLASYSWTTGAVIVPTYDSRADAEGLVLDANMALLLESVSITSYQVR